MPLPDYGHHNAEKKTHQDMVTIVSIETKNKEHYILSEKA